MQCPPHPSDKSLKILYSQISTSAQCKTRQTTQSQWSLTLSTLPKTCTTILWSHSIAEVILWWVHRQWPRFSTVEWRQMLETLAIRYIYLAPKISLLPQWTSYNLWALILTRFLGICASQAISMRRTFKRSDKDFANRGLITWITTLLSKLKKDSSYITVSSKTQRAKDLLMMKKSHRTFMCTYLKKVFSNTKRRSAENSQRLQHEGRICHLTRLVALIWLIKKQNR